MRSFLIRAGILGSAAAICSTVAGLPARAAPLTSSAQHSASGSEVSDQWRGQIVSVTGLGSLTREQVGTELKKAGFHSSEIRHGVRRYRLVYRTVDIHHRPTTASGLLILPRGNGKTLKTVSWTHGTQVNRDEAPSVTKESWTTAPAVTFAAAGLATVAPDYLGLGRGPGLHPWLDASSEATASLDMLRAARELAARRGVTLQRDVMVTGFSQGASAALGLGRLLQDGGDEWFRAAALAPISGAYHFREVELPAMLAGRLSPQWSTAYVSYLLVSWNRRHHLYDSPAEVFRAPYDRTLPPLFDGEHLGQDLQRELPAGLDDLLTPAGRRMLAHPTGSFAQALRVADSLCSDWAPSMPVRLYRTRTDEQAASANASACRDDLARQGARVKVVELGRTDHSGSVPRATARIVRWFSAMAEHSSSR